VTQEFVQQAATDAAAAGVSVEEPVYEDYFGFEETRTWYFPDGKQFISFKVMNEGDKARYQRATNRDITLSRQTGDAKIKSDPADERWELLQTCVTGWNVFRKNPSTGKYEPVPFSAGKGGTFAQWLGKANPKLVEKLEFEIRLANPWLQGDMSVEDIDSEIERLNEMREQAVKREQGKDAS
jgi:hypothetical protein